MKKVLRGALSSIALLVVVYVASIAIAHYGTCAYLSEEEVVELAREQIAKRVKMLVRHFKEPASDVQAGRFLLFSVFDDPGHPFGVTYQTPRGQLVDMEFTVTCGVRFTYSDRIMPREDAIFVRDLRTGEPFIRR